MFKRLFTAGSGALLVLALSGCAFANSVPKETLEGYFGAIATQDPESKLAAQAFAVPGSLADAYAIEQSAHTQAQLDGGVLSTETNEIVVEAERVLLCEPLAESVKKELDVEDYCSVYENFEFQDDKLVSFNAGPKPLEGRLTLGDSTVIDIGDIGSVEMLASYITIRGDLVVVAEVVSNTDTLRLPYDAVYLAPNGRQMDMTYLEGPSDLKSGRVGNVAYWFSGGTFGGTLEMKFLDADWNEVTVSVPTS